MDIYSSHTWNRYIANSNINSQTPKKKKYENGANIFFLS